MNALPAQIVHFLRALAATGLILCLAVALSIIHLLVLVPLLGLREGPPTFFIAVVFPAFLTGGWEPAPCCVPPHNLGVDGNQ